MEDETECPRRLAGAIAVVSAHRRVFRLFPIPRCPVAAGVHALMTRRGRGVTECPQDIEKCRVGRLQPARSRALSHRGAFAPQSLVGDSNPVSLPACPGSYSTIHKRTDCRPRRLATRHARAARDAGSSPFVVSRLFSVTLASMPGRPGLPGPPSAPCRCAFTVQWCSTMRPLPMTGEHVASLAGYPSGSSPASSRRRVSLFATSVSIRRGLTRCSGPPRPPPRCSPVPRLLFGRALRLYSRV